MLKLIKSLYDLFTTDVGDLFESVELEVERTWFAGLKSAEKDVAQIGVKLTAMYVRETKGMFAHRLKSDKGFNEWIKGYEDYIKYFENNACVIGSGKL